MVAHLMTLKPALLIVFAAAPFAFPQTLEISLKDALERARQHANVIQSAGLAAQIAHEDRVQSKAAQLPQAGLVNQFIYTQPNGSDTGVFVANNGARVFTNQVNVHEDLSLVNRYAYQRTIAAESIAKARVDLAARGLVATVVQAYYAILASEHRLRNAEHGATEAAHFLDITQKQERGGEVAHADVVKAQIQTDQRKRDVQDAQLGIEKAKVALAVLIFSDFTQAFHVTDDLQSALALPEREMVETTARATSPELNAARLTVQMEKTGVAAAHAGYYPTLSFDYFYGLNANQFAYRNNFGQLNLGSSAVVGLNVPVWSWGAIQSRIRQATLRQQQAKLDLNLTERQVSANIYSFYLEAQVAGKQIESLRRSVDLAGESVKLTLLRYEAGEATALEVVDAQTTLLQARNALDDGFARYRVALAALQTLTGTL
jgi:outer membrane protein TolC